MSDPERAHYDESTKLRPESEVLTEEQTEAIKQILLRIQPSLSEGETFESIKVWTWADLVARADNYPEAVRSRVKYWLNKASQRVTLRGSSFNQYPGEINNITVHLRDMLAAKPIYYWQGEVFGMFESFFRLEKKGHVSTWKNVDFWTLQSSLSKKFVAMAGWICRDGKDEWKVLLYEVLEDYKKTPSDVPDVKFAKIFGGDMVVRKGIDVVTDREVSKILANLLERREAGKKSFKGGWSNPK